MISKATALSFVSEMEKISGKRTTEVLMGLESVLRDPLTKEHAQNWSRHSALNLGMALAQVKQAITGVAYNGSKAVRKEEAKDALHSLAFALMPPSHHKPGDLAGMRASGGHMDWLRDGAGDIDSITKPRWRFLDKRGRPASNSWLKKAREEEIASGKPVEDANGDWGTPFRQKESHLHEGGKEGIHFKGTLAEARAELAKAREGKSLLKTATSISGNEDTEFLVEERARIDRLLHNRQVIHRDGPGARQTMGALSFIGGGAGLVAGGPRGSAVGGALGAVAARAKEHLLERRARAIEQVLASREQVKTAFLEELEKISGALTKNFAKLVKRTPDPGVRILSIEPAEKGKFLFHGSSQKMDTLDVARASSRKYGYEFTVPTVFASDRPSSLFTTEPVGEHARLVNESLDAGKGYPRVYHMVTQGDRKLYLGSKQGGFINVVHSDGWFKVHRQLLKGEGESRRWVDVHEYVKPGNAKVVASIPSAAFDWESVPHYEHVPALGGIETTVGEYLKHVKDPAVRKGIEDHLAKPFVPNVPAGLVPYMEKTAADLALYHASTRPGLKEIEPRLDPRTGEKAIFTKTYKEGTAPFALAGQSSYGNISHSTRAGKFTGGKAEVRKQLAEEGWIYEIHVPSDKAEKHSENTYLLREKATPTAIHKITRQEAEAMGWKFEKKAEYAKGLPDKKKTTPIRTTDKPQKWEVILQHHPAAKSGVHQDLRVIDPHSGIAHSWATKKPWPGPGERIRLYQQPDHTAEYSRNYAGHILSGYGRTKPDSKGVQKVMHEKMYVHRSSDRFLRFDTGEGKDLQKFVFVKLKEGDVPAQHPTWTLINVTPRPENAAKKAP